MKKFLFMAAAMLCVTAVNAKVWRINYDENAKADFRTLTEACADERVAETDTLYCEPGSHAAPVGDNTISRDGIKVLGPGWGYEPNYGGTSTMAAAEFSNTIQIAASNIKVSGLVASFYLKQVPSRVLKNITIDRCKCVSIDNINSYNDSLLNITIEKCFISYRLELGNGIKKDIYVRNSIIRLPRGGSFGIYMNVLGNVNLLHNTIIVEYVQSVCVQNALVQDNIIIDNYNNNKAFDFTQTGNVIRKNVFSLSGELSDNAQIIDNYPDNYYVGATEAGTFTCKSGSIYRLEEYYQLKDDSPAKGVAYDGGDCGAFGGSSPYVIGARPQGIPYLYDVEVPAEPKDNKLTVTFKVANQNE